MCESCAAAAACMPGSVCRSAHTEGYALLTCLCIAPVIELGWLRQAALAVAGRVCRQVDSLCMLEEDSARQGTRDVVCRQQAGVHSRQLHAQQQHQFSRPSLCELGSGCWVAPTAVCTCNSHEWSRRRSDSCCSSLTEQGAFRVHKEPGVTLSQAQFNSSSSFIQCPSDHTLLGSVVLVLCLQS
jgi:hypothetical protein